MTKKSLRKFAIIDFTRAIEAFLRMNEEEPLLKSVTCFCKPLSDVTQRVRVARSSKNILVVTYGKPNYEEREFLKECKKAKCNPKRFWYKYRRKQK